MTARVAATCSSTLTPPRQTGRMPPTRRSSVSFQRRSKVLGPLPMNHGRGSAGRGPGTANGAGPPPGGGPPAGGGGGGGGGGGPGGGGGGEPLQALLRPHPKAGRERLRAPRQLRRFVPATEDPHHLADDDAPGERRCGECQAFAALGDPMSVLLARTRKTPSMVAISRVLSDASPVLPTSRRVPPR